MSRSSPTGLQLAFLLFAVQFGGMLLTRPIAAALKVPPEHFNTVGNLIVFPLELLLILSFPATRELVVEVAFRPPNARGRIEAVIVAAMKITLTFGFMGVVYAGLGKVIDFDAMNRSYLSPWGVTLTLLMISFGPLAEEIIFRATLYRLWEQQWGWGAGMVLSAAAFSAVHPHNLVMTFLSGILYACLLRRTGSLWAPVICHMIFNFLVSWHVLGRTLQEVSYASADGVTFAPWFAGCFLVGAASYIAYVLLAARHPAAVD